MIGVRHKVIGDRDTLALRRYPRYFMIVLHVFSIRRLQDREPLSPVSRQFSAANAMDNLCVDVYILDSDRAQVVEPNLNFCELV